MANRVSRSRPAPVELPTRVTATRARPKTSHTVEPLEGGATILKRGTPRVTKYKFTFHTYGALPDWLDTYATVRKILKDAEREINAKWGGQHVFAEMTYDPYREDKDEPYERVT